MNLNSRCDRHSARPENLIEGSSRALIPTLIAYLANTDHGNTSATDSVEHFATRSVRIGMLQELLNDEIKKRAAPVPTHGGLKLADSPPCYNVPYQQLILFVPPCSETAPKHRCVDAFNARHYVRYLVVPSRNGALASGWSR